MLASPKFISFSAPKTGSLVPKSSFSTGKMSLGFSKTSHFKTVFPSNFAMGTQMRLMSSKIFIGNLSWSASEEELKDLFAQHGSVLSVKVVTDRETGRAKGFGFVEFDDDRSANSAISALNGKEFLGRDLRVSKANPPRPREY